MYVEYNNSLSLLLSAYFLDMLARILPGIFMLIIAVVCGYMFYQMKQLQDQTRAMQDTINQQKQQLTDINIPVEFIESISQSVAQSVVENITQSVALQSIIRDQLEKFLENDATVNALRHRIYDLENQDDPQGAGFLGQMINGVLLSGASVGAAKATIVEIHEDDAQKKKICADKDDIDFLTELAAAEDDKEEEEDEKK